MSRVSLSQSLSPPLGVHNPCLKKRLNKFVSPFYMVMVSGRAVTAGDIGTCTQYCCCHGNREGLVDRVIIGQSKRWVVGGTDSTGLEDELKDEGDGMGE